MKNKINKNIKWISLIVCSTTSFLTPFTSSSINVALPTIGNEFKIDTILLNWIATSFLFSLAIFLIPFGRFADVKGRRKMFMMGLTVYLFSSIFLILSNSINLLILLRFIQGIGGAMISSTSVAILTSIFPQNERGKALGINTSAVYIGLSAGPFIGGIIIHNFSWRILFLINIFISFIALMITYTLLKYEETSDGEFDFIGSIMYSLILALIIYGFSIHYNPISIPLITAGLILTVIFTLRSTKVKSPILDFKIFKNTTFTLSNITALINYSSTYALSYLLSLYLQYLRGFNPQQTGLILSIQPIVMSIFSPISGWLSDKIEPRIIVSTGMSIMTICLFLLSNIDFQSQLNLIAVILLILGFGYALFSSPNTNAVMSSIDRRFYGIASAILGTMRFIGQVISMIIAMLISSMIVSGTNITYDKLMLSIKVTFQVYSFLCFIGILTSLFRGKVRKN